MAYTKMIETEIDTNCSSSVTDALINIFNDLDILPQVAAPALKNILHSIYMSEGVEEDKLYEILNMLDKELKKIKKINKFSGRETSIH